MGDLKQLNIPIQGKKRDEWHEYVEQSTEYESVSQMVRTAVQKEISGRYEGGGLDRGELIEVLDDQVTGLLEDMDRDVRSIERTATQIEEIVGQTPVRFTEMEILSAIPKSEDRAITLPELIDKLGDPFDGATVSQIVGEMVERGEVTKDGNEYWR